MFCVLSPLYKTGANFAVFSRATNIPELWDMTPYCFVDVYPRTKRHGVISHASYLHFKAFFSNLQNATLSSACVDSIHVDPSWWLACRGAQYHWSRHSGLLRPTRSKYPRGLPRYILYEQRFGCHSAQYKPTLLLQLSLPISWQKLLSHSITQLSVFCLMNVWQWRNFVVPGLQVIAIVDSLLGFDTPT